MEQKKPNNGNPLKGKIKKFDQKLYDLYDVPSREILKEKLGSCVSDNPDIYAEDMILNLENCKYKFIELQVCATWLNLYPHQQLYVYERKAKFSENTLFILFDKHFKKGYLFDRSSLIDKPERIKKYSKTFIYYIKWYKTLFFKIEDLNCDLIKKYIEKCG